MLMEQFQRVNMLRHGHLLLKKPKSLRLHAPLNRIHRPDPNAFGPDILLC